MNTHTRNTAHGGDADANAFGSEKWCKVFNKHGFCLDGFKDARHGDAHHLRGAELPTLWEGDAADAVPMTLPLKVSAEQANKQVPCVRACYAAAPTEKMVQAIEAMANCVRALHDAGNK